MVTLSDTGDERDKRMRVKRREEGNERLGGHIPLLWPRHLENVLKGKKEKSYWEALGVLISSHLETTPHTENIWLDDLIWLASSLDITFHQES